MTDLERWVGSQSRRLALGVFLARSADALAVFLLVFGSIVLAVKLIQPAWWPNILWLAIAAIPALAWAWHRSRLDGFSRTEAVALLDRRMGAGGLLMTLAETTDPRWSGRLPSSAAEWRNHLPKIRPTRAARRLWLPLVFLVGAFCIPPREARTETVRANVVGQDAAQNLEAALTLLQESEALDQQETEELKDAIQKLAEQTKDAPLTHESWETVDALRNRMQVRVTDSLTAASQAQEAADVLAKELSGDGNELNAEKRDRLEAELSESLRKMSKAGQFSKASPQLQKQLQALMKKNGGGLPKSGEAREKMLSELKSFLDAESKRLGECRGKCKGCEGGLCESDEFSLEPGPDGNGKGGRGGVNRGRGDADLNYGDDASAEGIKFKETVLPPASSEEPGKDVISVSAADPKVEPASKAPRGAVREAGPTTGRETWNRNLRPKHRAAVRSYFQSTGSTKATKP